MFERACGVTSGNASQKLRRAQVSGKTDGGDDRVGRDTFVSAALIEQCERVAHTAVRHAGEQRGRIRLQIQVLLLRETASTDARVLGYYRNGTSVQLLGESGSFYKVTVGGKSGYMMKKYIKVTGSSTGGSSTLPQTPFTAKLVNPNGNYIVNFRTAPGLSSPIIKAHPVGTEITVLEVGDVWCKAEIDGVTGYVSRYFFQAVK